MQVLFCYWFTVVPLDFQLQPPAHDDHSCTFVVLSGSHCCTTMPVSSVWKKLCLADYKLYITEQNNSLIVSFTKELTDHSSFLSLITLYIIWCLTASPMNNLISYPNITAFHSMMLLSEGAPLTPAGGSSWSLQPATETQINAIQWLKIEIEVNSKDWNFMLSKQTTVFSTRDTC